MPDGDFVKNKPTGKFGTAADGLAEGRPLTEVAKDVADAVASAIRKYGDEPINLITTAVNVIREVFQDEHLRTDTDWVVASYSLDTHLRQIWGNRDGLELALDVCKQAYLDVRDGATWDNPMLATVERYVWRIYDARFAESLPLDAIYSKGDPAYLAERERELRPYMTIYIVDMARRITESGRAKNLKNPRIGEKKSSIMDDLWGNHD